MEQRFSYGVDWHTGTWGQGQHLLAMANEDDLRQVVKALVVPPKLDVACKVPLEYLQPSDREAVSRSTLINLAKGRTQFILAHTG